MRLRLQDISLPVYIGVYDWEKSHHQMVQISLVLKLSPLPASGRPMVDYDVLTKALHATFAYKRYEWIEGFAERIADWLLQQEGIMGAKVCLKKGVVLQGTPTQVSIEVKR